MKKIILITVILCTILLFNACTNEQTIERTPMQRADSYSNLMEFHNSLGQVMLYYASLKNRGYTQIIFVHSEEEFLTGDFPDDAVIAWPSLSSRIRLDGFNMWIRENEKEDVIKAYSLSYPVTNEDLVDKWEEILEVWRSYSLRDRLALWIMDEFGIMWGEELRVLREAFEAAGINIAEHGLRSIGDTTTFNRETNRIIIFELYDKLDEDVQLRLLDEIPYFMAVYRDEQRRRAVSEARRLAEQEEYEGEE